MANLRIAASGDRVGQGMALARNTATAASLNTLVAAAPGPTVRSPARRLLPTCVTSND